MLVYIAGSILLLFVLTRTPLLDRIAEAIGTLAGECLRLFFGLLISLIGEGEGEETVQQAQGAGPDFAGMIQRTQPPVWLEVLEKILTTAAALAMVAGAVALIVLFVRFLIRAFYGREGRKKNSSGRGCGRGRVSGPLRRKARQKASACGRDFGYQGETYLL